MTTSGGRPPATCALRITLPACKKMRPVKVRARVQHFLHGVPAADGVDAMPALSQARVISMAARARRMPSRRCFLLAGYLAALTSCAGGLLPLDSSCVCVHAVCQRCGIGQTAMALRGGEARSGAPAVESGEAAAEDENEGEDEDSDADLWAESVDFDAGEKRLPASLARAVAEALEDNEPCYPGAPASTRESLEAAAWEYYKLIRDPAPGEGGDVADADDFAFAGAPGDERAEQIRNFLRKARQIREDPAIAAYLDRVHLTQPPSEYGADTKSPDGVATAQTSGDAWRGNWLGVGGHWTSLMHACRVGAIDVVKPLIATNQSLANHAESHSGLTALHWLASSAAAPNGLMTAPRPQLLDANDPAATDGVKDDVPSDLSPHVECARVVLGAMDAEMVNARDSEGRTALSMAVSKIDCSLPLINLLLTHGRHRTKQGRAKHNPRSAPIHMPTSERMQRACMHAYSQSPANRAVRANVDSMTLSLQVPTSTLPTSKAVARFTGPR